MMLLDSYLNAAFDRIATIIQATANENFDEFHDEMMTVVRADMTRIVDMIGCLLGECCDAIHACEVSNERAAEMDKQVNAMNEEMAKFTKKWIQTLKDKKQYGVNSSTLAENVVGSNLCTLMVVTTKFAENLQQKNGFVLPNDALSW